MAKKKIKKVVKKKVIKKVAKKVVAKKATAKKKLSVKKKTLAKKVAVQKMVSKPAVKAVKSVKAADLKNFVTPLDDRLIVQVENEERMTAGGLYIPDTVQDSKSYLKGLILAVGRGHRDLKGRIKPMDVKVGDQVLFNSMSGAKLTYQSVDLKIIRETDVMGVIDKD